MYVMYGVWFTKSDVNQYLQHQAAVGTGCCGLRDDKVKDNLLFELSLEATIQEPPPP